MLVERSARKPEKNPHINQNYGYGAINENIPKLRILHKMRIWNVFMNVFAITIMIIVGIFFTVSHFQCASFEYHQPNIRLIKYFPKSLCWIQQTKVYNYITTGLS